MVAYVTSDRFWSDGWGMVGLGVGVTCPSGWPTKPTDFTDPSQVGVGAGVVGGRVGTVFAGVTTWVTDGVTATVGVVRIPVPGPVPAIGPTRRGLTSRARTAKATMAMTTTRMSCFSIRIQRF